MNGDELTTASIAIVRTAVGWHSKIARLLNCDSRRISEWIKANQTPPWVDAKIAQLMELKDSTPWPRDEWIVGYGIGGDGKVRRYVIHTAPPRFIARAVETDEEGLPRTEEEPADVLSGTVYVADGSLDDGDLVLAEIDWIDQPNAGELAHFMESAADALENYDELITDDH